MQLKRWIARQDEPAIGDALEECGFGGPEPSCGAKDDDRTIVEIDRRDGEQ
jgi:hypothetical protein